MDPGPALGPLSTGTAGTIEGETRDRFALNRVMFTDGLDCVYLICMLCCLICMLYAVLLSLLLFENHTGLG